MKFCQKCVLPGTFPGIKFDEKGICNYCLDSKKASGFKVDKIEYQDKFNDLMNKYKGKSSYDAIMAYSGGKDSTYTLKLLKNKYKLKVLAITFDNGFISEQTSKNIYIVVETLGIDHITFKPSFDFLKKVFVHCGTQHIFANKTIERASTICTACMAIIKYTSLRFAIEKDIPFIFFGWSPGQAPITSSIMKNNPQMIKITQRSLYDPLFKVVGDEIRPYFLEEKHFRGSYNYPYNIHPLAFLNYDEKKIFKSIAKLGWISPKDVDANSTNCLLNSFANVVHKKNFGFNPYSFELAGLVRQGSLGRNEALKRLLEDEDSKTVAFVKNKLGM